MNIVIAGAGKVGYSLARQLSKENHDVTVIDCKPERIEYVTSNLDVFAVPVSYTHLTLPTTCQV